MILRVVVQADSAHVLGPLRRRCLQKQTEEHEF